MNAEEAYREMERVCMKIDCPQCRALCLDFVHAFITSHCVINDCDYVMLPALERVHAISGQLLSKKKEVVLEE